VLDTGEEVIAKPVNVTGIGARTTLSVRPERLVINPRVSSYANCFRARVLEAIYLGEQIRYRVRLAGNEDFTLKVRNDSTLGVIRTGDEIEVCWNSLDCQALDAVS
jgi:putative spermidine/putrescine transport system ATP-binding protein